MKRIYLSAMIIFILSIFGCTQIQETENSKKTSSTEVVSEEASTDATTEVISTEFSSSETVTSSESNDIGTEEVTISEEADKVDDVTKEAEAVTTEDSSVQKDIYVGEYVDVDDNESYLIINQNNDGSYYIHISRSRLANLDEGTGILTDNGVEFSVMDPAGNTMKGIISISGEMATVTFTDSSWTYIHSNEIQQYKRGQIKYY